MPQASYQAARFLLSAMSMTQLPPDEGYEIAFAGYSNVGKSSVLNVATQQKQLAKISKQPGRTQAINVFVCTDEHRIIDLPGYGYAKVSRSIQEKWNHLLAQYVEERQCLRGLILIMDSRHPLKPLDHFLIDWTKRSKLGLHVLLNKSDKLNRQTANHTLNQVNAQLIAGNDQASVQLFSAKSRQGQSTLWQKLDEWFDLR